MSNKILVSVMGAILLGIITWWVNKVNDSMEITKALQWRSQYLDGTIPSAPLPHTTKPKE